MPEDNLAHRVTRTLILFRVHLNAITTYQKLYGRVVTCLKYVGNSPLCGIKLPGNTPLRCVYIKGQNECCAFRTLSALVGGGAREVSGVEFTRRNYPDLYNIGDFAGAYIAMFCTQKMRYACTHLPPLKRSLSVLSRLTTAFRQSPATT